jgi:hypothetical protein
MADTRDIAELRGTQSHFGAWFAVVLLFAIFGAFVWVAIGAGPRGTDFDDKRAKDRSDKLSKLHEQADTSLNGYAWIDKNKGTARIPIEQAMKVTLTELSQKKPAPAGPIAPDATAGGTQNAAPMTPPQGLAPAAAAPSATPVSKGGHEAEAPQNAGQINPAPVAPGTQPGANATPAASPPSHSGHPNPQGPPQPQATATPHGSPIPVPGKTP